MRIELWSEADRALFTQIFTYLHGRGRYGVITNYSNTIKDIYLAPLTPDAVIPSEFLPFEGPGLPSQRKETLLLIVVKTRSTKPFTPIIRSSAIKPIEAVKESKQIDSTVDEKVISEEDEYDPAQAGLGKDLVLFLSRLLYVNFFQLLQM